MLLGCEIGFIKAEAFVSLVLREKVFSLLLLLLVVGVAAFLLQIILQQPESVSLRALSANGVGDWNLQYISCKGFCTSKAAFVQTELSRPCFLLENI